MNLKIEGFLLPNNLIALKQMTLLSHMMGTAHLERETQEI